MLWKYYVIKYLEKHIKTLTSLTLVMKKIKKHGPYNEKG